MNLRQLESFVRVAELGSFSQAARVLDIAQRDTPVERNTTRLSPSVGLRLTRPLIESFHAQLPGVCASVCQGSSAHIADVKREWPRQPGPALQP